MTNTPINLRPLLKYLNKQNYLQLYFLLGEAVRCWTCNSQLDIRCRDYFNITGLQENKLYQENFSNTFGEVRQIITAPHIEHCEGKQIPPSDHKWICSKTVTKGKNEKFLIRINF